MQQSETFYSENAKTYIEQTLPCDMSMHYEYFLPHLPQNASILDLGFGSGRDMIAFQSMGYTTKGIDPTKAFVERMAGLGYDVEEGTAQSMTYQNEFDGIWACSSLLHVPSEALHLAFSRISNALKPCGFVYCSFKYGSFEGERDGRYYTDLTEESILPHLENTGLALISYSLTSDIRPNNTTLWLNCILQKEG